MAKLPEWVEKYKEKGTTIRKINNKYYKYKVHSERQKGKKYPVLVQDALLGTITEDGFISSNKKMVMPSELEVSSIYNLISESIDDKKYSYEDILLLKEIYVIKINKEWYYTKLNDEQKKLIERYNIGEKNGKFI